MVVNGKAQRTIWLEDENTVKIIDQRNLPHRFEVVSLKSVEEVAIAIKEMWVRGAPLIGATAAYGMYFAVKEAENTCHTEQEKNEYISKSSQKLAATRPTAVNLEWAINRQLKAIETSKSFNEKITISLNTANNILEEDVDICSRIGDFGLPLIEEISKSKEGDVVNILTHCNAGWLACVDWGTATAPIYKAHDKGIKVHVWVDETRPRNQGARLTAWELGQHGIPHTIISDNVGGHLMQHNQVDLCIVGTDRTTYTGDVANKIGTYLKALAAKDNNIPFYVALPSTTIDWTMKDGVKEIPIETRSGEEVNYMQGLDKDGILQKVRITPLNSKAVNYGFDVTPRHLITKLITERGVCNATELDISRLFSNENKGKC